MDVEAALRVLEDLPGQPEQVKFAGRSAADSRLVKRPAELGLDPGADCFYADP